MGLQQFNEVYPIIGDYSFTSTYTANTKETLVSAPGTNNRIDTIQAVNTDSAAHVLSVFLGPAATPQPLGTVTIPAGSGTGTTAPVDVLVQLRPANYHYLLGSSATTLQISLDTVPSGSNVVAVHADGGTV